MGRVGGRGRWRDREEGGGTESKRGETVKGKGETEMSRNTKREEKYEKITARWRNGCGEARQCKEWREREIVGERHKKQKR